MNFIPNFFNLESFGGILDWAHTKDSACDFSFVNKDMSHVISVVSKH